MKKHHEIAATLKQEKDVGEQNLRKLRKIVAKFDHVQKRQQ
jgi:hypothetical protein